MSAAAGPDGAAGVVWPAPGWATSSVPSGDGTLSHAREVDGLECQDAATGVRPLALSARRLDRLGVDAGGRVFLERTGEPMVVLDGTVRLTLSQADDLAATLRALVDGVRADGGAVGDEACLVCGTARGEHRSTVHAWTGSDEGEHRVGGAR